MRRILLVVGALALMAPFTIGAGSGLTAHQKLTLTNRVAPSGTVTADMQSVSR